MLSYDAGGKTKGDVSLPNSYINSFFFDMNTCLKCKAPRYKQNDDQAKNEKKTNNRKKTNGENDMKPYTSDIYSYHYIYFNLI
jgi:hypothetical protein